MINEILERFKQIDMLIQEHKTGTPAALAQTVGVSKRTIYKYIRLMKKRGAPIAYNILAKSYYYETEGCFVCAFTNRIKNENLEKTGLKKIKMKIKTMKEYFEIMNATLGFTNNN